MTLTPSAASAAPGTTTAVEAADFDAWQRSTSSVFVPLRAQAVGGNAFHGRLRGVSHADVAAIRVDASSHRVERTEELLGRGDGFFKFGLQLAGHGLLVQAGRETVVRPGDLSVYDTSRPYSLTFEEAASTLVLMVPHARMGAAAADVAELVALRLGEDGMADVVVPVLRGLARRLDGEANGGGVRLLQHAVDLLGTLCDEEAERLLGGSADDPRRQLRAVMRYIDAHLGVPELSPQAVADAHFVSVRSLYKLFDDSGTTVAAWIRRRRLERAREDLLDPRRSHESVGTIATRWGLPDPAHFSRLFRAAYGVSPSVARERAALAA